ncbi:uncharacterized protein LOC114861307 isoform X3 [Betta splendens]|uniref:Uncharacterized protein LOC114861307 isoform X3 n=1 Tax=Betta splendens TaxID=158456 RepID=A0A9W2Y0J9_BETSP|nr:uncharacterized protein LOC114861307 isoform X3 [Betta splendens]
MAPSEKDTNKKEIKEEEQDLVLMYPGQLNITIKEDQNHEFTDQDQYRHEVKEETLDPDFVDLQNWSSGVKQENQDSGAINYEHHFVKQDHIKSEIKEETQDLDISDRNHTKSEVEEENQKPNISDQNHHGGGIDEQDRNQDHRSSDPTERTDQQSGVKENSYVLHLYSSCSASNVFQNIMKTKKILTSPQPTAHNCTCSTPETILSK